MELELLSPYEVPGDRFVEVFQVRDVLKVAHLKGVLSEVLCQGPGVRESAGRHSCQIYLAVTWIGYLTGVKDYFIALFGAIFEIATDIGIKLREVYAERIIHVVFRHVYRSSVKRYAVAGKSLNFPQVRLVIVLW